MHNKIGRYEQNQVARMLASEIAKTLVGNISDEQLEKVLRAKDAFRQAQATLHEEVQSLVQDIRFS